MRTEDEMMALILGIARDDERIRAVYMNGSRANPAAEKDVYRDYDIVYVVTETASFIKDRHWLSNFGESAMVQEPDSNDLGWGQQNDTGRSYCWLMLFTDGNRIDLRIQINEAMLDNYSNDSMTVPLLDKDGILPSLPPPSDSGYWIKQPSITQYASCCNEFWWCLNNVAKGLIRDQIPYAMRMYNSIVHPELDKMLEWHIGARTAFTVTTGLWGKYFNKYLSPEMYQLYLKTFSDAGGLWAAIFSACGLFHTAAADVGARLGYPYNQADEENMLRYLRQMKKQARQDLA